MRLTIEQVLAGKDTGVNTVSLSHLLKYGASVEDVLMNDRPKELSIAR